MHGGHAILRGFTLIELLVVISIIALLSSIVLASLNTARGKGSDGAIKANLNNARTQAELFYAANGNLYSVSGGFVPATSVCNIVANVNGVTGIYTQVKAAADAAGVTLSLVNSAASSPTQAVCHACPPASASTVTCNPRNAFAAQVPLKGGDYFCVDNTGFSGVTNTVLDAFDTQCN